MATSVKCTPFCNPCQRGYKHHELLIALLNTDTNGSLNSTEHDNLAKVIRKYEAAGWNRNSEIMDNNEEFRFPILHWACALGKAQTVQWLLDNGFDPTVQSKMTQETAVHRALLALPELASKTGRLSSFSAMLAGLKPCLAIGDQRQNTPLHVAAQCMARGKSFILFEKFFLIMVSEVKEMPEKERAKCVNALNSTGDTPMHILAASNKSLNAIQSLLAAGADQLIVNKLSINPLEIAKRNGAARVVNYLKTMLLKGCNSGGIEYHANEEMRKRRSERWSTYCSSMATWNRGYQPGDNTNCDEWSESGSSDHQDALSNSDMLEDTNRLETRKDDSATHDTCTISQNKQKTPTVSSSGFVDVKAEDEEACHCAEDTAVDISCGNDKDPTRTTDDVPILNVLKQAGVLPNLNDVISKTRKQHLSKLKIAEKSLADTENELEKQGEQETAIKVDIDTKRKELEQLGVQLNKLRKEQEEISNKRKLFEEECDDLKNKLLCCEKLLKTVPKDLT